MSLPTFEQMRREAYGMLGDVADVLRSDWKDGTGPTPEQGAALRKAFQSIARAKTALNEAAR